MRLFKSVVFALTMLLAFSTYAAAQENTQNSSGLSETELAVSELQQWYCKLQGVIERVGIVHLWFNRVKENSVVFVDKNGHEMPAPYRVAWKKSAECLINERTNEKSEKTEKSG